MEPPSSTEPLPALDSLTTAHLLGFFILAILLLFSALLSGAETAYFSMSGDDTRQLKEGKSKTFTRVLRLLASPGYLLSSITLLNTLANVSFVLLSVYLATSLTQAPFSIGNLLLLAAFVAIVLLLLGEVIPKLLAAHGRLSLACFMAYPLSVAVTVTKPFTVLMVKLSSLVEGMRKRNSKNEASIDDLSDAISIAQSRSDEDKRLLKGIVDLVNTDVKKVMHPRVDVAAVDINASFDELYRYVVDCGYSRIPVFDGHFDNVKGVLYIKDLLPYLGESKTDFEWQTLIRPVYIIPESKHINDLLREFQQKRIHMAVVVDEYGGISGIVTLEDILEEIVGEISDETDTDEDEAVKLKDGSYLFDGSTTLGDLCRRMGVDDELFDDIDKDVETLAGLVLNLKGGFPDRDEEFGFNGFLIKVVDIEGRRIRKVKVSLRDEEQK